MSNGSEHTPERPLRDRGVYILPCVCGAELVEVSEDALKAAALAHVREHEARGEYPSDFADPTDPDANADLAKLREVTR